MLSRATTIRTETQVGANTAERVGSLFEDIITGSVVSAFELVGNNNTFVTTGNVIGDLIKGHVYRVGVLRTDIPMTNVTSGSSYYRFSAELFENGTSIGRRAYTYMGTSLESSYYVKIPTADNTYTMEIGMRANSGETQTFVVEDVTESYANIANDLAKGLPVTLNLGGVVAFGDIATTYNNKYLAVWGINGTALSSLSSDSAYGYVYYKIPLAGIEWVELYQTRYNSTNGSVICDVSDNAIFGVLTKSGKEMGGFIVPPNASYLLYATKAGNARVVLHPKNELKREIADTDTRANGGTLTINSLSEMISFNGRGSSYATNTVGSDFFSACLDKQYDNTNYELYAVDVENFDTIQFNSWRTSSTYGSFVTDADGEILARFPNPTGHATLTDVFTLPAGAKWFIYNFYTSDTPYVQAVHASDKVSPTDLQNALDGIVNNGEYNQPTMIDESITMTTGHYMNPDGTTGTSTADLSFYSQKIDVQEGDELLLMNNSCDVIQIRIVTAFDSTDTAVTAKGMGTAHYRYVVPSGVAKVVVSYIGTSQTYVFLRIMRPTLTAFSTGKPQGIGGQVLRVGTTTDGTAYRLRPWAAKFRNRLMLTANVSSLSSGTIYLGCIYANGTPTPYLSINATTLLWHNGDTADVSISHGLTIADDIQVAIIQRDYPVGDSAANVDIQVSSQGETYTWSRKFRFLLDNRPLGFKASGVVLNDAVVSMSVDNINSPIWYFGDSYITIASDRWVRPYIDTFGMNILLSGYAGANTITMYERCLELLAFHRPKYIVWGLGMNDADDNSTTTNTDWKWATFSRLVPLCDALGIKLILCTIPTTPSRWNNAKNAEVRASGLPYVDFDLAVRPDQSVRTWITGCLDSDNAHPTSKGAKVLYHALITDFPQITTL